MTYFSLLWEKTTRTKILGLHGAWKLKLS